MLQFRNPVIWLDFFNIENLQVYYQFDNKKREADRCIIATVRFQNATSCPLPAPS